MISAVIASYKEPLTIGKAVKSIASQLSKEDEIIVTAPDKETQDAARKTSTGAIPLIVIQDGGKGKPAALNKAIKKAKNPFLLLSDGDVFIGKKSVGLLKRHFSNSSVGIATGRVVPSNTPDSYLGFWARAMCEAFHRLRMKRQKEGTIIATGYLYMVRKNLFPFIPEETLADDAYVSHYILEKGSAIVYEPRAEVHVKYPTTLPDWLRQKKRTAGRVYQLSERFKVSKMHSFADEISVGLGIITDVRRLREVFWLIGLFVLKFYVWMRVFFDHRLWKKKFANAWERVESTK